MRASACCRLSFLLLWPLLMGCDGKESAETYHFVNAPTAHRVNLARLLGERLTLVSATDTLELRVRFERATRTSMVLNARSGDTLMRGWVTRHRRLYYFAEPLRDSTYWIHAWRRTSGMVQGLTDDAAQMLALRAATDAGRLPPALVLPVLRADTLFTKRLRYEAAALRPVFEALVDSCPPYRLQTAAPARLAAGEAGAAALIGEVYPNPAPAGGLVHVRTGGAAEVSYTLLDAQGRRWRRGQQLRASFTLPLENVPAGTYLLRLTEPASGRTATRHLVVE
ncbi:T9SS type A sorting domain-containing protein [Hymenobacter edaphi]|uniref:Secretion system C-terminal sorting domain-containing protein n=1 Tax=Hymenobacter edaphi TaxID=2211146 RepID=A0A328BAY6_9BACT|nr:T9SS type A sorting domain-containing protein [Hymenobacter edaphi]RAK63939.1 hypothetical protein DLM85_20555 [Hymenobacter edaphi]